MIRCASFAIAALLSFSAYSLEVGDPAPGFTLPELQEDGDPAEVALDDFRGKVVYLDFWASWCAPCKVSLPLLNEMRNDYIAEGKPVEVLAVNVDRDPLDGIDFLIDHPVSYTVLEDAAGETPALYEVRGMPTAFLIDAEGTIRMIHDGFKRSDIGIISEEIDRLLETMP